MNVEELNEDGVKDEDESNIENKTDENLMPVFSEWTQQIQEAEKKLVESNSNSSDLNKKDNKNETSQSKQTQVKNRLKNYASSADCGAKILSSSPDSKSTSSVLNDKDEYMLSPCTEKIWFVVELCEAIQASKVELANTELFSSPLKEVTISVSNRFPTRDWTTLGRYQTKNERDLQVFDFVSSIFGKFVRVDLTYTNSEHFCPLSYFRIYGTSEIEAFEVDNEPVAENNLDDVDDEIESEGELKVNDNILNRAGAAVMQMVAKAAEALSKNGNGNRTSHSTKIDINATNCISLSYDLMCLQCANENRRQLEILLTCKDHILYELLDDNVKDHLISSNICSETLGSNLKSVGTTRSSFNFLSSILPTRYLVAMCHLIANDQKTLTQNKNTIQSQLDSKTDELSLKNVSKKENDHCKQTNENNPPVKQSTLADDNDSNASFGLEKLYTKTNQSKDNESNIFNVNNEQSLEKVEQNNEDNSENRMKIETIEVTTPAILVDFNTPPGQLGQTAVKQENLEQRNRQETDQLKIPQQISSNHPESVFLRLSNRIKTLEKNMTLSTQYLEELSKRYKRQIEDLQLAFTKLQSSIDQEMTKGIDRDEKLEQMKFSVQQNFSYLNEKSYFVEITMGVLVLVIIVQMFIILMIYRHVSLLTRKWDSVQSYTDDSVSNLPMTSRKRQRNRVRKISAPNILSQKYSSSNKNDGIFNNVLRTSSVPKMHYTEGFEKKEDKENTLQSLHDVNIQTSLEENDEILIPGFEDLNLKDNDAASETTFKDAESKYIMSLDEPSSTLFHSRNNSLNLDNRRKQKVLIHKKALSESPPNIHQKYFAEHTDRNSQGLLRTQPENGNIVTFKKSNSLKKLFKKIF